MVSPNAEGPTLLEGSAVHCEVKTKNCCPFLFSVEAYVEGLWGHSFPDQCDNKWFKGKGNEIIDTHSRNNLQLFLTKP